MSFTSLNLTKNIHLKNLNIKNSKIKELGIKGMRNSSFIHGISSTPSLEHNKIHENLRNSKAIRLLKKSTSKSKMTQSNPYLRGK